MSVPVALSGFATATATASRSTTTAATATAARPATAVPMVRMTAVLRCLHIAGQELRRDGRGRHLVPDVVLDFRQRHGVFLAREADGITFSPSACRAADAVYVVRGVLRQVKVEYVTDVRNVQPARRYV